VSGHGYGGYANGCRCAVCIEAKREYMQHKRAAARVVSMRNTTGAPGEIGSHRYIAPGITHGTAAGYTDACCRCLDCTQARTAHDRRYRPRAVR
jgi:hypothetical protein